MFVGTLSLSNNSLPLHAPTLKTLMAEGESFGFRVGQRVHAAGNPRRTGTVRYIGPVTGHQGSWVGVDWDDDEGKHDGSVDGIRYFTARSDKSGSLVRAKNLSAGISFIEALLLRYRSESTAEEEDEMYVLSTRNKRVSVQLVGKHKIEEKLKHFDELTSASVSYLGVSSMGSADEINALVPNIKELDLTGNLLSKWQDIDTICEALPSLEVLNLTNDLMEHDLSTLPSLRHIRILVLNNCGITWEEVEKLKQSLHAIEELHFMGNQLLSITPASSARSTNIILGFVSLRLLNLEDNCIDSWDEIVKLSHLPSLEQLHLNKNKLKRIYYPHANHSGSEVADSDMSHGKSRVPFESLQCLLLGIFL